MWRIAACALLAWTIGAPLPAVARPLQADQRLMVGAARRETTPRPEWLPLLGVARTRLVAVIDPIHVRVIAVGSGATRALIVTFEAGGPPDPAVFLKGLADHTGIPVDAIYWGATHGHTSPGLAIDPDVPSTKLYSDFVYRQVIEAADEAIGAMRPATVGIGYAQSHINVNRQAEFTRPDGTRYGAQGFNPTGPSDKTLAVVRFATPAGEPIAFVVHYSVHNTAMYANRFNADGAGISGDIGGAVSRAIEQKFPGAVANWMAGTSGDQNPILSNEYFTPNTQTGQQEVSLMSRAVGELLDFYGKVQFADVLRAIASIPASTGDARVSYAYGGTTLPAYTSGEKDFAIQLKVLRIGDIALVGNPGELFNSIGVYMRNHSLLRHTLVSNHVRNFTALEQFTSYMPDDDALLHDGWHTNNRRYKVGTIDGGFTALMNTLIEQTSRQPADQAAAAAR